MRGRDRPAPFGLPDGSALLVGTLVGFFLVGALVGIFLVGALVVAAEPEPDAPEFEAFVGAASSWFEWSRKHAPAHAGMCNPRSGTCIVLLVCGCSCGCSRLPLAPGWCPARC